MPELLTPDICVIGGGAAGIAVATRARAYGASVVLIEKSRLGGDTLNSGALPAAALAAAARRAHYLRTAGAFGIANDEPKINARGVFEHVHAVIDAIAPENSAERLTALGIEVILAEGRFADKRTVVAGDRRIRARRFVIATGSAPVVPEIAGLAEIPYFTPASIIDNTRKLTHLVVIGAGPAGIELAQAHRRLGAEVTVVESGIPLAECDPELADIALRRLADEGVIIRSGTEVVAVQQRSLGIGVTIRSGEAEEILDASHVLVAAGRRPNLDGLGLEAAGVRRPGPNPAPLALRHNLKTATNRRIYAVGDVTGTIRGGQAARYHADLVVRGILLGTPTRNDPFQVPLAIFTEPEIAEIGLTEAQAHRRHGTDYRVLRRGLAENARARAERQTYGLIKVVTDRGGRLLGAGIVGPNAAEMIALFAFALANNMSARHFRNFVAAHPSLVEIVEDLADEAMRQEAETPLRARLVALRRMLP